MNNESKCGWRSNCFNKGLHPCSNMDEIDSATFYGGPDEIWVCQDCLFEIENRRHYILAYSNENN